MALNLQDKKILLVEDYPAMRLSIKEMLTQSKAQHIIEAAEAKTALMALEKHKFDIVLCDFNLGQGKNGQQLLEEIKYRQLLPYSAIFIIVTAEHSQSMVLCTMENKPDEYLTKPFNAVQLLSRIEKQLNRKAYLAGIEQALAQDNLGLAINECERLLQHNDPKTRTQLLKIGAELAINAGDFKTAQRYYQEVLNHRELAWAKHGLGVVAALQNQHENAITLFKAVLQQAPMTMETYDWLAKSLEATQRPEEAQQVLKQALELSPQVIVRQQKLAHLAEKTGNVELAQKAYKSAIKLGQHSMFRACREFAGLAKQYLRSGDNVNTLKLIAQMRIEFPHHPETELRAAYLETLLYQAQKNKAQAALAYAKIAPIVQQSAELPNDLLLDLVESHFVMANKAAAQSLLADLIRNYVDDELFIQEVLQRYRVLNPNDAYAETTFKNAKQALIETNNIGVSLFKQGKVAEALQLLEAAYQQTPYNKFILMNLLKILVHNLKITGVTYEQYTKAQAYLAKAVALGIAPDKIGRVKIDLGQLKLET